MFLSAASVMASISPKPTLPSVPPSLFPFTIARQSTTAEIFTVSSLIILPIGVDMGNMKRREGREAKEWTTIRPVLMQFRYDHTVSLWRVTFRPHGDSVPLPRVIHFGHAEKLRELFRRFGSRRMAEDVAALEFAMRSGGGAIELMLGEAQLCKLRQHKKPTLNTERGVAHRTA